MDAADPPRDHSVFRKGEGRRSVDKEVLPPTAGLSCDKKVYHQI